MVVGPTGSPADADVLRRFEPTLAVALAGSPALRPVLERLRAGLGTQTPSAELLMSLVSDTNPDRRGTTLLELTGREEAYHDWPPGVLDALLALALDTE